VFDAHGEGRGGEEEGSSMLARTPSDTDDPIASAMLRYVIHSVPLSTSCGWFIVKC